MVFNARRCASAVYCPVSVCPSVSRTQVGIVYTTTTKYRIVETAPSIARNSTLLTLQILMKLEWDHPLLPKPPRFYSAPQCSHCKRCTSYSNSVCLSVCLSVCPSVTRRYCVKTTARSTVQFALSDSKMCLVL